MLKGVSLREGRWGPPAGQWQVPTERGLLRAQGYQGSEAEERLLFLPLSAVWPLSGMGPCWASFFLVEESGPKREEVSLAG